MPEETTTDNTNVEETAAPEETQQETTEQTQETTEETQETKTEETQETKTEETTVEGAPEKYEDFTLPEGVAVNEELMGEFTTLAKELNLPQEGAQKFIDLVPKYAEAIQAETAKAWNDAREKWVADLRSDANFGGDNFDKTIERAQRVLRSYGSETLTKFLGESGYGDNSDLIRMLAKIDIALGEDHFVEGRPSGDKGTLDPASVLYPNQGKK